MQVIIPPWLENDIHQIKKLHSWAVVFYHWTWRYVPNPCNMLKKMWYRKGAGWPAEEKLVQLPTLPYICWVILGDRCSMTPPVSMPNSLDAFLIKALRNLLGRHTIARDVSLKSQKEVSEHFSSKTLSMASGGVLACCRDKVILTWVAEKQLCQYLQIQ